ncbi:MAG: ATP-dependent DNA helicase [Aureliella sp.]
MAVSTESSALSTEQEYAVAAIRQRLAKDGKDFWLNGPAGTGKTTVAQFVAKSLPGCTVCAPTGKACEVLSRKGIAAQTLHSWLYRFEGLERGEDGRERPIFAAKRTAKARFLIVDEASMLTRTIHRDIRGKGIPTLYLGDEAQLPPVESQSVERLSNADYTLTEIHRQAAGSPIIQLAHCIRRGGSIFSPHDGIDIEAVCDSDEIAARILGGIDRVIVRTNRSRVLINQSVRKLLGRAGVLEPGDEVICLANNYASGFINGQSFTVRKIISEDKATVFAELMPDCGGSAVFAQMLKAQFGRQQKLSEPGGASLFDYGWAITGHKAQGSQWRHVGVLAFGPASDMRRWDYTAVTRAQEKLTLFRYVPKSEGRK